MHVDEAKRVLEEIGMIDVVLNEAEERLAIYLAKRRFQNARRMGVYNAKVGDQSNEATDQDGTGAEIGGCRMLNIFPDTTIPARPEDIPAHDGILPDGRTVDFKQTAYPDGHLLVKIEKRQNPADIYVLMVGSLPKYRCAGYATKEEVFRDENIGDLGHGPCYLIPQERLHHDILGIKK